MDAVENNIMSWPEKEFEGSGVKFSNFSRFSMFFQELVILLEKLKFHFRMVSMSEAGRNWDKIAQLVLFSH